MNGCRMYHVARFTSGLEELTALSANSHTSGGIRLSETPFRMLVLIFNTIHYPKK